MENILSNRYKIFLTFLLSIIALANVLMAFNRGVSTITVTGQGSVSVKPGEVSMVVTRATIANTADEAITQGEAAMTRIIESAKKLIGNNIEIKKSFYQVTPQEDGRFLMANAINLKTTNVSSAGNLIKYLYTNGATTVSNVIFSPKDDGATENKSREDALSSAKKNAEIMAKSMKKKIGKIISIAEDTSNFSSSISEGNITGSDVGSIVIEKRISVVYEIK